MTEPSFKRLRFAPSPNGYLHLGHAYSALLNKYLSQLSSGELFLRIEDIDRVRSKPEFVTAIFEDLKWLGLTWQKPVIFQSDRFDQYRDKLNWLISKKLVYRAFLSRQQIRRFVAGFEQKTQQDWPRDPDGAPLYPDMCKQLSEQMSDQRARDGEPFTWRLDVQKAISFVAQKLTWREYDMNFKYEEIVAEPERWGDVVIARKDTPTSYHLSVVLDDADQGIDFVVRGMDLYHTTSIHRLLQAVFNLPEPGYMHHKLILDAYGRKLSKSDHATSVRSLREVRGLTVSDIKREIDIPIMG